MTKKIEEVTQGKRGPKPSGPLAPLLKCFGNYETLAINVGCSARSLQRYNAGGHDVPKPVRHMLEMLAKSRGLKAPFKTGGVK